MQTLQASVARFAGKRVAVIGDLMLDTFVYGQCSRISPEAPIPVIKVEREVAMLGGAGNVARNVAALGGEVTLIGLVGDDAAGAGLRAQIAAEPGITADLVVDGRPTTQKVRYVAGQQMLRADIEQSHDADSAPILAAVERHLASVDVVILSDYAKGVLTPTLLRAVIDRAVEMGKPIVADPKSTDIGRYDGCTLLTPNTSEATAAAGMSCDGDEAVERASHVLLAHLPNTAAVLITRGAQGMTLARRGDQAVHLPAAAREVFDVSGAGDTVVATLALGLAAGGDLESAVELGNLAAGMAVSKPGTAVVAAAELIHELRSEQVHSSERKIADVDDAVSIVANWRKQGSKIGFTNGCFDLIHPGHVSQLSQARSTCDHLIVGLNTDASIRRLKGPDRPIQDETARAIVLASLASVDLVIPFSEDTPIDLIAAIRPDVLIKGKDYSVEEVVGADLVQSYGGRVFLADIAPGHSTTGIISRLMTKAG